MDIEDIALSSAEYIPDNRKAKIRAMVELWEYIERVFETIVNWAGTKDEAAEQLSHDILRIMHPHFTGMEIHEKLKDVFQVIQIEKEYTRTFTDQFFDMILSRLKRM